MIPRGLLQTHHITMQFLTRTFLITFMFGCRRSPDLDKEF